MQLPVLKHLDHRADLPVLGTFSKALTGSISINYGLSAGENCSKDCGLRNNGCYAEKLESGYRRNMAQKLHRHEVIGPVEVTTRAIDEVRKIKRPIPWARISTNGSVPMPSDASPSFVSSLRDLCSLLVDRSVPLHFPVETASKARWYRDRFDDLATVRESAELDAHRFLTASASVPISGVAGNMSNTRQQRLAIAREMAKVRKRNTGRTTIVCPAIASHWHTSAPAVKCGEGEGGCTACADPRYDIIYPHTS